MSTITQLDAAGLRRHATELAHVLRNCVLHGASVGFLLPCSQEEAEAFWLALAPQVDSGERLLFIAHDDHGALCGTVQLVLCRLPNGRHRAEISKMLVHSGARRQGIAQALMRHALARAGALGCKLLVLDTCTGFPAQGMYEKLGFAVTGVVPDYAALPDGTLGPTTFMHMRL
ncbi:N-acetyltransferase [Duganella rhizosphaerae]|uniref:GNAT family N-acetyltransferase n=1 Tax=Duganella rhizosphaerae TaxID=2885763 RepID=UPI0030EA673A